MTDRIWFKSQPWNGTWHGAYRIKKALERILIDTDISFGVTRYLVSPDQAAFQIGNLRRVVTPHKRLCLTNEDLRRISNLKPGEEARQMSPQHDLIIFTASDDERQLEGNVKAAMQAFSMTRQEAERAFNCELRIRCRPSQFGRFIVIRSKLVGCNRILQLRAELIPGNTDVDVSMRAPFHDYEDCC